MASTIKERLAEVRLNPALVQQTVLDDLSSQLDEDGFQVPDATNPFVYLMELGTIQMSLGITEGYTLLRKNYPRMSLTTEDLYLHMSDVDYVDRFASPSETTFEFILSLSEIKAKALPVGDTGISKLTIPRYTTATAGDLTFTMQYPIDIKVMRHGGLQIGYDTSITSPISTLTTNIVDWEMIMLRDGKFVKLSVPMQQFSIDSHSLSLSAADIVNTSFGFSDQFFYCRVFHKASSSSDWEEIATTHSDQNFNPLVKTALLQVNGSNLTVRIPVVYNKNETMSTGNLRVDIYTTKGPITSDLGGLASDQFSYKLLDLNETNTYSAPLQSFSAFSVIARGTVDGGANQKTFEELREQVIQNTLGSNDIPISTPQLGSHLKNKGFNVVTNIDNITNRQFLATRSVPEPANGMISGGIGIASLVLRSSYEDLVRHTGTYYNGNRLTLTPSTLYEYRDGKASIVADNTRKELLAQSPDTIVREVNAKRYLYSPFYTVLDISDSGFDVRKYDLNKPVVNFKSLVGVNDTSMMQANITSYNIEKTTDGYLISFVVTGDDAFNALPEDNLVVQLSYKPQKENSWAACNATFVQNSQNERVYKAEIKTNYDINSSHGLKTTNLSIGSRSMFNFSMDLETDIDITFIATNQDMLGYVVDDIDEMIQSHLIDSNTGMMCISRERLQVTFGHNLEALWGPHRTITSEEDYERATEDEPYVYTENVYKRDEKGQYVYEVKDGKVVFTLLHAKGDVKTDGAGNTVYRYRKGDFKRDPDGNLVLKNARSLVREFTMFFVDGMFYFVTDVEAVSYRTEACSLIVDWIEELESLKGRLLDQSKIYLYPTRTFGNVSVMVRDGQSISIPMGQSFTVNYYVTDVAYRNNEFREAVIKATHNIIASCLSKSTVSHSDIISTLQSYSSDGIISFDITGLGGAYNLTTVSTTDDGSRLSLARRLAIRSNNTITIEDAVDINFIRHSL